MSLNRLALLAPLLLLAAAPAAPKLYPLSDRDMEKTTESGCQYAFRTGNSTDTLVYMIGHDFMIRTPSGVKTCKVTDAQFGLIGEGKSGLTCGGVRLQVRRTGRTQANQESDSSDGAASLTVSSGRASRAVAGRWGVAC